MVSSPSIQAVVQQMQALATQAGAAQKGTLVATSVGKGGFAGELYSSIQRINQLQAHSRSRVRALEAGEPGVSLPDVMVDVQKAGLAMQMGVQVRNRVVSAYRDIMNMQV